MFINVGVTVLPCRVLTFKEMFVVSVQSVIQTGHPVTPDAVAQANSRLSSYFRLHPKT